jgi:hypothetical protein
MFITTHIPTMVLELPFLIEPEDLPPKCENPIHVPVSLRYHSYNYTQLCRGRRSCLYRMTCNEETVGFEVFIIRIQAEAIFKGKIYPAHEKWPSDNDFGKSAWSSMTLEGAIRRYNELER